MTDEEAIAAVRAKLSRRFISGRGLEIGAGARPFPVPPGAQVSYGDMRDRAACTCRARYQEHLRYVHPILSGQRSSEVEIQRQATDAARLWPNYGAHFHAWTRAEFEALLQTARDFVPFRLIHAVSAANE